MNQVPSRPIDSEIFVELVEFVENLLGSSRLQKLLCRYERAIELGNKKYIPHRLVYNYRAARNSLDTLLNSPPSCDVIAMVELALFRGFVQEFRDDPVWPEIEPDLFSTGSFVHMMCLLQFVSMQRARGNNAELLPTSSDGSKSADAVVYTLARDRIDVEVKAPELLWAPGQLTADEAQKVVKNAWKKSRQQIRNGPSILLLGGLFVPKGSLAILEEAARNFLERKKNQHVGYIMINSITIGVKNPLYTSDGISIEVGPETSVAPQIAMRSVKNPHYRGAVEFLESDREIPGYSVSGESSEFTINAPAYPES